MKDLTSDNCSSPKPAFRTVVPDGKPLPIDWFTGLLLSPHGSNDGDSYSLEFLDTFEKYSLFEIDRGILRKEKHFSNTEYKTFRIRQFAAFKKTSEYADTAKKIKAGRPQTEAEVDSSILRWFLWSSYTKKIFVD